MHYCHSPQETFRPCLLTFKFCVIFALKYFIEEIALLLRSLLTAVSVVGLIYSRASAKAVHLKYVNLSDTLNPNIGIVPR
jgi:hypothetical protein